MIRRAVPLTLVPLCAVAGLLAASLWLRAFPAGVMAVPLYGAALLSVLVPAVVALAAPRRLWLGALIDVLALLIYLLAVVLREPVGFTDLIDGLYHGPSQLLTFALPLVSPRSLMVAPVVLTWLAGALSAECMARRWFTVLPYAGFLVAFGLAYAGTERSVTSGLDTAHLHETLVAAGLLVSLLLLRVAQAWVRQDETSESTQPDGILPVRGLFVGALTTLVVVLIAALAVQSNAFAKQSATPQRVPSVDDSRPLTPVSFIAGVRPHNQKLSGTAVFTVSIDRAAPGYFGIANVDIYDGSGWSFDRTFRPSGGVLPADADTALRRSGPTVTQSYRITPGPLTAAPWIPVLYRAQKVTGTAVNIDAGSGMIVPTSNLRAGEQYTVRSTSAPSTFDQLQAASSTADTATPSVDTQIPGTLRTTLDKLVTAFSEETGTPPVPALPFLQALQKDLRTKYTLTGAAAPSTSSTTSPATRTSAAVHKTAVHKPAVRKPIKGLAPKAKAPAIATRTTAKPTPTPSSSAPAADRAGSTSFADVLSSILGARSGTPEQYATLIALVARDLGVPARVAAGFRVAPTAGTTRLAAGTYHVSTAQAWTWAEVPIVGAGWVVLDSAPGQYTDVKQQANAGAAPTPSSSATPSQNAQITKGDGGHAVAKKSNVAPTSTSARGGAIEALLVAVGALLAALLIILLSRKRFRRARRRRSPDPRARLLGAWQESIDMLTEAGLPGLTNLTSAEIAELAGEQFGGEPALQTAFIGQAANSVVYSARTVVGSADADAAWEAQQALRRTVHRGLGARGRVSASLRYHRVGKSDAPVGPQSWATSGAAGATTAKRSGRRGRRAH